MVRSMYQRTAVRNAKPDNCRVFEIHGPDTGKIAFGIFRDFQVFAGGSSRGQQVNKTGRWAVDLANALFCRLWRSQRSEERRVGKEGVGTCRARGSPYH